MTIEVAATADFTELGVGPEKWPGWTIRELRFADAAAVTSAQDRVAACDVIEDATGCELSTDSRTGALGLCTGMGMQVTSTQVNLAAALQSSNALS